MRRSSIFGVLLAVLCTWTTFAANWYVKGVSGNDVTGFGTPSAPYKTVGKIVSLDVLAPGDTIYAAEIMREAITFTAPNNLTICQWPGQTKYDIRGAFVASGWSATGEGYTKALASGLIIKSVVVDWDTSFDAYGLHYGHLTPAADAATALATLNNWHYDSGTGILSINIGADPSTHVIEYCIGGVGVSGIGFGNADGLRILDFRASLWVDSTPASGQAIRGHGRNVLIEVDRVDDCGYHHICFADGLCNNNIIRASLTGAGIIAGANVNGIPLVFHTSVPGQANNLAENLIVYETPLLNRAATPVADSPTIHACFSHTSGGVRFDGITWRNIQVRCPHVIGVSSSPFGAADTTPPSSAANSRISTNYGVRFIDCEVSGDHAQGMVVAGSAIYQRCKLRFGEDRFTAEVGGWITDTGDGAVKYTMFDACEILINQGNGAVGATEGFRQGALAGFVFLNSSVVMWGARTAECRMFSQFSPTQTIYARQSIFGYPDATSGTRRLFNNDSWGQTSNPRNFENCAYIRITAFGYSSNPSYWTPALWRSSVDTSAQQFPLSNVFEEPHAGQPMSHARLATTGPLYPYRNLTATPHTQMGVNKKPWTGTLGCYQYPGGPVAAELHP